MGQAGTNKKEGFYMKNKKWMAILLGGIMANTETTIDAVMHPQRNMQTMEVIIINESLGF